MYLLPVCAVSPSAVISSIDEPSNQQPPTQDMGVAQAVAPDANSRSAVPYRRRCPFIVVGNVGNVGAVADKQAQYILYSLYMTKKNDHDR